jgi:AraC-like DNA-binding protein
MDALGDLVKEACRLIRRGEAFAAHAQLHDVATAARALRANEATGLGACLYAWLVRISDAAESAGLPGGGVDAALASEFADQLPQETLVDRFEARVILILEATKPPDPSNQALVSRSKLYIDANFPLGIKVADVHKALRCSGSTLRKAWREVEGPDSATPTMVAYLKRCRVQGAKPRLLANPKKSIEQVADEVGCCRGTLDRGFIKFEGMTAAAWRSRNLQAKRPSA